MSLIPGWWVGQGGRVESNHRSDDAAVYRRGGPQ